MEGDRPLLNGPVEGGRSSTAGVQPRFGGDQPALEGVDPDREPGALVGQSLNRDAETRMRIEQGLVARVPPTALAPPVRGLRASPSFGGTGSTHPLGDKRFFRPLVGVGAQPFRAGKTSAIGVQPFNGQGTQPPFGGIGGAAGGRVGR